MNDFKSTDDARTENSGVRKTYRKLSDQEKFSIDEIKDLGDEFLKAIAFYQEHYCEGDGGKAREFALARTHLEDAVMRAVRGITQ
ncbi:hypothetical protein SAMN05444007_103370 [Cribrihabitans marinus]|uniref:Acb2/Tad1 hairpin domain-containing protein n=1 Tax=Cribrihabitans marinus TaxID=1227549 RepID=A0A1H6W5C0_9RHOB|nr:hypothetical protein [Cribrihabitans marinus]GGH24625.1 hypothetical protein GCM10010973_11250 [Cribrihabitans marinus]SEJ12158.1 hypothetical protein SAMN05444007_103370 [Cribrihabitans marinus]